jgi:hypothetical protein
VHRLGYNKIRALMVSLNGRGKIDQAGVFRGLRVRSNNRRLCQQIAEPNGAIPDLIGGKCRPRKHSVKGLRDIQGMSDRVIFRRQFREAMPDEEAGAYGNDCDEKNGQCSSH